MDMQQMRQRVQDAYGNPGWSKRVDKMSDSQVVAIFHRLQEKGVIK